MPEPTSPPLNLFPPDAPGKVRVLSNRRLTPPATDDIRLITLGLGGSGFQYREGQSVGIVVPGLPDRGHASSLRFFSIASSRYGEEGSGRTLSLCVKRTRKLDPETGRELPTPAGLLCDAEPGLELGISGPFGKTFLLPDNPASNLILVATGTGIAPFRAFLRRIYLELADWSGQVRLYAGCRTSGEALFRDEISGLALRPGFRASWACSQEEQAPDGQRLHVEHLIAADVDELWQLLDDPRTHLYICGVRGMEVPVDRVLETRAHADGISFRAFHRMLQDTGRLLVETY